MGEKFEEIDVERINIVDPDGTLRLTISNRERQPDAVMDGQFLRSRKGETGAGFIFFNEEGDECGGFNWRSGGAGFSFDQHKQDEALTVSYRESDGKRATGILIQDRPTEVPISKIVVEELHPAMAMEEGPEKAETIARVRAKFAGKPRVQLGRNTEGESQLVLGDSQGRPRIRLYVDSNDTPRFEMLDEKGEVTFSLPPAG